MHFVAILKAILRGNEIDWQAKLDSAESALRHDPDGRDAGRRRAQAIGGLGRLDEAFALLKAHVARFADDGRAWDLLSAYLCDQERYAAAIEAGSNAVVHSDSLIPHYNRACAHALAGNTEQALDDLRIAIPCDEWLRGHAREDESFAALRDNAEFQTIVAPVGR